MVWVPIPHQPVMMRTGTRIWKARQKRHESSADWGEERRTRSATDANSRSRSRDQRVKLTIEGLAIDRNSRVLDIGSGRERSPSPLSPLVKEITAVEPGEGMVAI